MQRKKRHWSNVSDTTSNSKKQKTDNCNLDDEHNHKIKKGSRYNQLELTFLKDQIKQEKIEDIISNYNLKFTNSEREEKQIKNKIKSLLKDKDTHNFELLNKAILCTNKSYVVYEYRGFGRTEVSSDWANDYGATKSEITTWIKENTDMKQNKISKLLNAAIENKQIIKFKNKRDSNHVKYCLVDKYKPKDLTNNDNVADWKDHIHYREYFEEYCEIYKALHNSELIKNNNVYTKIIEILCLFAIRIHPKRCSMRKCDVKYGYEYTFKNKEGNNNIIYLCAGCANCKRKCQECECDVIHKDALICDECNGYHVCLNKCDEKRKCWRCKKSFCLGIEWKYYSYGCDTGYSCADCSKSGIMVRDIFIGGGSLWH
eukprot:442373_1